MNLITIHQQEVTTTEAINSVNARDLYKHLEVKKDFSNWIKAQIKRGMFREGVDYQVLLAQKGEQKDGSGGHNAKDYLLTMDTAKGIALMSGTPKGDETRRYFISIEKQYLSLVEIINNAVKKHSLGMPQEQNKRRVGTPLSNKEKGICDMGFAAKYTDASLSRIIGCDSRTIAGYRTKQEEEAQERTLSLFDKEQGEADEK